MKTAIIGAGLAGLQVARRLDAAGHDVELFEKARGPGGRMSARRIDDVSFDHGAQYFTARDPGFRAEVETWVEAGLVAPWRGRIVRIDGDGVAPDPGRDPRYVGVPRMSALARHLLGERRARFGTRIERAARFDGRWSLWAEDGSESAGFDWLVVAVPAPQAVPLLAPVPALAAEAARVHMLACHAVMVRFAESPALDFDGARVGDSPLAWIARNDSKPGRAPSPCWVLHSTPDWSVRHIDEPADAVAKQLLAAFGEVTGVRVPEPIHLAAHRWLYARPEIPLDGATLVDPGEGVAVCGDWTGGDRVEAAFRSAERTTGAILNAVAGR